MELLCFGIKNQELVFFVSSWNTSSSFCSCFCMDKTARLFWTANWNKCGRMSVFPSDFSFQVFPLIFSTLAILFFYSVAMCWFNKKIVTDTAVHILLSLLISNISALLFLFFIKYFFTSTIICFASAVVFLLVFVQQITQRIVFMQKIKIV